MQHLALFSEYGRIALNNKVVGENGEEEEVVVPEHAKDEKPFQSICFLVSWQLVVVTRWKEGERGRRKLAVLDYD